MIQPYFSLLMYSGLNNPQIILTKEQGDKVIELCAQLDKPIDTPMRAWPDWVNGEVGPTSYMIYWHDPEVSILDEVYSADLMGVHTLSSGRIRVYRKQDNYFGKSFEDTIGLWEYLSPIGEKLIARHFRDAQEAMDDYYEKVLGVSQQTKI